jgi:4-amino-4-deoxy-L-arabinose transferase-like glycosyltransferase
MGYAFVALTRIGLTPDRAYWGEPGVPVMAWQFGLVLVFGAILFLAELWRQRGWRLDLIMGAAIWLVAILIWLNVPLDVMRNSFYAPINPPANQPLPNSDAGYYDSMAHSLLIGYPYQGDIPTRPLYISLLAALHVLAGERYDWVIVGQTLVLALTPVVLYFLGKRLHSRTAGLMMALFAIFREWNSLLVSSQTRVSNTKTLLSDLPTLLFILLACLFVVRWLQRRDRKDALISGGLLGLLLLLRTQTLLLVPIVIFMALLAYGLRNRTWQIPVALFAVGVAAGLVPWLAHNYLQSGRITLDAPFEYQVIASQYKYTGNLDLKAADLKGKGLAGVLLEFAVKDPRFVAGFISAHFSATMIDSLLVLPLAARYDGLMAPLNLYWMQWPAGLDGTNALLLLLYLAVIALGFGAAWMRLRWAGLVPLAFALGYAVSNGIARFSGWRYDLPADWVGYVYLAIGAAELLGMVALLFGARREDVPVSATAEAPAVLTGRTVGLLALGFMLVSALPWMAEGIAAPRYAGQDLPALVSELASSPAVQKLQIDQSQIDAFAANPDATLQIGRVLYPRYFPRNTGLPSSHPWPAYAVRDFPRVGFLLLNQSRHDALIPLRQVDPGFEQGADAIVLGCQRMDYIDARLVLFPASGTAYLAAPLTQPCK